MKMSPLSCAIFVGLFCAIYASPVDDDDVIILPKFVPGTFKTQPSTKTGDLVAMWNPSMKMNPGEMGEYFEGDIMMKISMTRSGFNATTSRWLNGVVPVSFAGTHTLSETAMILRAMHEIQTKTCIKFVTRFHQTDYVRITNAPTGCWGYIGRIGGQQDMNLQNPACVTMIGEPIHFFLHALGVVHEHSSPNRDSFVTVNVTNVLAGYESNFNKYTTTEVNNFNQAYDYGSVTHFSTHAFSKNGLPTIVPKQSGVTIGQRNGMSASDVATVKAMYGCL